MPVDGNGVGAHGLGGKRSLDEGNVVAHEKGDAITRPNAKRAQGGGEAAHALIQIGMCQCARAADEPTQELGHDRRLAIRAAGSLALLTVAASHAPRLPMVSVRWLI